MSSGRASFVRRKRWNGPNRAQEAVLVRRERRQVASPTSARRRWPRAAARCPARAAPGWSDHPDCPAPQPFRLRRCPRRRHPRTHPDQKTTPSIQRPGKRYKKLNRDFPEKTGKTQQKSTICLVLNLRIIDDLRWCWGHVTPWVGVRGDWCVARWTYLLLVRTLEPRLVLTAGILSSPRPPLINVSLPPVWILDGPDGPTGAHALPRPCRHPRASYFSGRSIGFQKMVEYYYVVHLRCPFFFIWVRAPLTFCYQMWHSSAFRLSFKNAVSAGINFKVQKIQRWEMLVKRDFVRLAQQSLKSSPFKKSWSDCCYHA